MFVKGKSAWISRQSVRPQWAGMQRKCCLICQLISQTSCNSFMWNANLIVGSIWICESVRNWFCFHKRRFTNLQVIPLLSLIVLQMACILEKTFRKSTTSQEVWDLNLSIIAALQSEIYERCILQILLSIEDGLRTFIVFVQTNLSPLLLSAF